MQTEAPPKRDDVHASSAIPQLDLITLIAISILVYTVSSVLHEGLGHGLVRVLLGGKVSVIASTVCVGTGPDLGLAADRMVAGAGTLVNLLAAGLCLVLLSSTRVLSPWFQYFLWLSFAVNGFLGAGYLAVPTFIGFGDWMVVLRGLHPHWFWRTGMILLGVILYAAVAYFAMRTLEPLLGCNKQVRSKRALWLTLLPYFAGGLAFCAAGLFNPVGARLVLISAAASSFGGASGLAWLSSWSLGRGPDGTTPEQPANLPKSMLWILIGSASGAFLILFLGRGISFNR